MNTKVLFAILLVALVLISGCVDAPASEGAAEESEIIVEEEIIVVEEQEPEEPAPTPAVETAEPRIKTLLTVGNGKMPAMIEYNETLYIVYGKFTGTVFDLHYNTYNGGISKKTKVASTTKDDMYPSLAVYKGQLFLFWTESPSLTSLNNLIDYVVCDGTRWGKTQTVSGLDYNPYTRTSATTQDNVLYLTWNEGLFEQQGKIYSKKWTGSEWLAGPLQTIGIANEKNPALTSYKDMLHMLFESYYETKNEIFEKGFELEWRKATQLTNSENPAYKTTGSVAVFDDLLYMTWYADDEIYMSTYNGRTYSDAVQLTNNTYVDESPAIAAYNGKLYISWVDYENNNVPYIRLGVLAE